MVVTTVAGPKPVAETARPALDAIWATLSPHINGAYANFLSSTTEADVAAESVNGQVHLADPPGRLVVLLA